MLRKFLLDTRAGLSEIREKQRKFFGMECNDLPHTSRIVQLHAITKSAIKNEYRFNDAAFAYGKRREITTEQCVPCETFLRGKFRV